MTWVEEIEDAMVRDLVKAKNENQVHFVVRWGVRRAVHECRERIATCASVADALYMLSRLTDGDT